MSFDRMWAEILPVGRNPVTGGYRRYAYQPDELWLREWFTTQAAVRGLTVDEDNNGNLWAWFVPEGGSKAHAFVTGSHFDSVPDGGAFDGPLGIVTAFSAWDMLREKGITPSRSMAICAFVEEEGARFGIACLGSRLMTGAIDPARAAALKDADGTSLEKAMSDTGRDPAHLGPSADLTDQVAVFIELHVEQGKALELIDAPIAVASAIWPHGRWRFTFDGEANHAGTTRLVDRRDPMLAYASTVQAARAAAEDHDSRVTFGKIAVLPNGTNAVPSQVIGWLDARSADDSTLSAVVDDIAQHAKDAAAQHHCEINVTEESVTPIVEFDADVQRRMIDALTSLYGDVPVLPTQAGHDAAILGTQVPTGMLFVRNPSGISHSPDEFAPAEYCHEGVKALAAVMESWLT